MSATFRIAGQEFMGLNGGAHHSFTPAVSFFVGCDTQDEVDHLWDALVEGGQPMLGMVKLDSTVLQRAYDGVA